MSSAEVSALTSAQPSSQAMAETPAVAPSSVYSWRLSTGWDQPILSRQDPPLAAIGFDTTVIAKTDTHPDVVADLIAEFMTDTVLRIDSDASVDIHVVVKEDLIMVTGQVGCSHPAKSAIVHSDQFLSTLNSSIRDLLRDLGFGVTSTPPSTLQPSTPPTVGEKSPKKQPSNSSGIATPGPSEDSSNDAIDPTNVHVIIAITPCEKTALDRTTVRGTASKMELSDLAPAARTLVEKISASLGKASLAGGVVVELSYHNSRVEKISVGIDAALTEQLLSGMAKDIMNNQFLGGLTALIAPETLIEIRQTERTRTTGVSSRFTGKDWAKPARHGHVIARQEAVNLVKTGACTMCEVTLTYAPSFTAEASLAVVSVNSFGSADDKQLAQQVRERLAQRSVREIKESILKDANATLFSLHRGGSVCNHEFVTEPQI